MATPSKPSDQIGVHPSAPFLYRSAKRNTRTKSKLPMIIEIALGIVLAVLILAALPYILRLIAGAGAIAAIVVVFILVVTFVLEKPAVLFAIPFAAAVFALQKYYNKSSKVRIFGSS